MNTRLLPFVFSLILGVVLFVGLLALAGVWQAQAASQANCVAGPHSGSLAAWQDWCPEDNPHLVTDTVIVPEGVTLTLRPGVIVQAASDKWIQVTGVLHAIGTPDQPITLTSSADSGPGQWAGLYLTNGEADLRHVTLRYAGQYNTWGYASINVAYSTLYLEDSHVRDSANVGNADYGVHLCCGGASATITNTTFANIGDTTADYGVFNASDSITVTNSTFQGITGYPMQITAADLHRVDGNTFSGNGINRILVLGSSGTLAVGAQMAFQTGLDAYELTGGLSVPNGKTLTIEPGVMLMARSGGFLHILGHLAAIGTLAQPITITSAANSGPGEWGGIYVQEGTCDLRYLTLRYTGQTILGNQATGALMIQSANNSAMNLDHVTLSSNALASGPDFGLIINGGNVTLNDSLITGNGNTIGDYAVYLNAGEITATHTIIQGNAGFGFYMAGGKAGLTCSTVSSNGSDGARVGSGVFSATGSGFYNNAGMGINNLGGAKAAAAYNWWGHASGPGGMGPGSGDEVSANVVYTPWLSEETCFTGTYIYLPLVRRQDSR